MKRPTTLEIVTQDVELYMRFAASGKTAKRTVILGKQFLVSSVDVVYRTYLPSELFGGLPSVADDQSVPIATIKLIEVVEI